jgi:hypothetical protein
MKSEEKMPRYSTDGAITVLKHRHSAVTDYFSALSAYTHQLVSSSGAVVMQYIN